MSAITAANVEAAQRSWKSWGLSPTVIAGTLNGLAPVFRVAIKLGICRRARYRRLTVPVQASNE